MREEALRFWTHRPINQKILPELMPLSSPETTETAEGLGITSGVRERERIRLVKENGSHEEKTQRKDTGGGSFFLFFIELTGMTLVNIII